MKRIRVLLASILIQCCIGGIYAWSTFAPALSDHHGLSVSQAATVFGVTILVFTSAMVWAGRLLETLGPRRVCAIGASLFGLGYLMASFSSASFVSLFVCLGLVSGTGIGFCYVCPLTTCMRWFPERKGLVTGVTVAGFGAGAVILANATRGITDGGADVLIVFRWIGIVYGSIILLGASQLALPPRSESTPSRRALPRRNILTRKDFRVLAAGMFAGTFGGLLVISNLKAIGLASGVSINDATLAISLFAVGNASGRILWGAIHDRLGRGAIPLSLAMLALAMLLLAAPVPPAVFLVLTLATGFAFGGSFVLYAAELASVYGTHNVGRYYPLIFLAYGVAGLMGPGVGGWLFDRFQSFLPAICLGAGVAGLGAIALCFPGRRPESETLETPAKPMDRSNRVPLKVESFRR